MKTKSGYICSECGHKSVRWFGKCPSCENFNTFQESVLESPAPQKRPLQSRSEALPLKKIEMVTEKRVSTGIGELNRVLSGGFVEGSLTLVGGEPGVGKSTLLLQLCQSLGDRGKSVLYVSGEESAKQIKMRAERLSVNSESLFVLSETDIDEVLASIEVHKADFVVIDSIQTMAKNDLSQMPGSVTQVRECAHELMRVAKQTGTSVIIIGHVTKEGSLAGPKILEHMVDTVLYFEGERHASYRLIRAVKNRFGTTNEIGMFEMREEGLIEITNPSEYMLNGRPLNVPGSIVTCALEGTRPLLTEAQALSVFTSFGIPRRLATGIDLNRVLMIIAALEKRVGIKLSDQDIYINIAGGIKISEPAADAAIASCICSSFRNKPINPKTIVFGEVGLTGEIRAVTSAEKRINESYKLGFPNCICPEANLRSFLGKTPSDMHVMGVRNLHELFDVLFS